MNGQSPNEPLFDVKGLAAVSSVGFLEAVFQLYRDKKPFALVKNESETPEQLHLSEIITPNSGGGWFAIQQAPALGDEPAQIVFTSGTTGASKAIVLTYNNLADVVSRLNQVMDVDSSIREYVGVPVTFSFGLGRCRAVAAVGGQCFIPENGFNPTEIEQMLAAGEINAISAVPSQWRILLANPGLLENHGKAVKWIEIGSQYMSAGEKQDLKRLFPNARIVQHYGLTEASRTTFLEIDQTPEAQLESVGRALGKVETSISNEGIIQVRGPHVTPGQLIDGEIVPLTDTEGWLSTGDKGELQDGWLYFKGRADDVINCGGLKVNPDAFQQKLTEYLPGIKGIAVSKYTDRVRGEAVLVVRQSDSPVSEKELEQAAFSVASQYDKSVAAGVRVFTVDQIPATDTGKIKRGELTQLYEERQKEDQEHSIDQTAGQSIQGLFQQVFKLQTVSPSSTFESLNGDSINHVDLSLAIERQLGHQPPNWETMTVEQLESMSSDKVNTGKIVGWFRKSRLEMNLFLRVFAILCVVATHAGLGIVSGGTLLIMVLVGYNLSRFKFNNIIRGNPVKAMLPYVVRILVPYYLLAAVYLLWNQSLDWDVLLLYANLIEWDITVVFPFWFVQNLIQCFIIIACVTSIPVVRRRLLANPWLTSYVLLLLFVALRLIYPLFWNTEVQGHLVPTRFIGIIWMGWTAYLCKTYYQKFLTIAVALVFAYVDYGFSRLALWWGLGMPILLYIGSVVMPALARFTALQIAAATFYIFIFNGLFIYLFQNLFGISNIIVGSFVGLIGSMAVWWLFELKGMAYWVVSRFRPYRTKEYLHNTGS